MTRYKDGASRTLRFVFLDFRVLCISGVLYRILSSYIIRGCGYVVVAIVGGGDDASRLAWYSGTMYHFEHKRTFVHIPFLSKKTKCGKNVEMFVCNTHSTHSNQTAGILYLEISIFNFLVLSSVPLMAYFTPPPVFILFFVFSPVSGVSVVSLN